eukprot:8075688-Pyramimonas_sp.AAC.1
MARLSAPRGACDRVGRGPAAPESSGKVLRSRDREAGGLKAREMIIKAVRDSLVVAAGLREDNLPERAERVGH